METGLYYYGYRYYSANIGSWINRDPFSDIMPAINRTISEYILTSKAKNQISNLYTYIENDPINYFDYLGLFGASGHSLITTYSLISYGMSSAMLEKVIEGNLYVDRYSNFMNNNEHAIRNWFQSVENAKMQSYLFRQKQLRAAIEAIQKGKCKNALFEFGQGLHNIQDEVAHKYGTLLPLLLNVVFIEDSHLNPVIIYRDSYPTPSQLVTATSKSKEYVDRFINKINCNPFKDKDSIFSSGLNRSCCCTVSV